MAQLTWLHYQNKWVLGTGFCGLLLLLINGTIWPFSNRKHSAKIILVINECTLYCLSVSKC